MNLLSPFKKDLGDIKTAVMGQKFDMPDREIKGLGGETESLMDLDRARSNESEADIQGQMLRGVEQDVSPVMQDFMRQQGSLGGESPMSQAIASRKSKKYSQDINAIKRKAEYDAPVEKQNRLDQAAQDSIVRANVAAGVSDRVRQDQLSQWQYQQQQKTARNQAIMGILGLGVKVGATALGGPAAGMAVGAAQSSQPQAMAGQSYQQSSNLA